MIKREDRPGYNPSEGFRLLIDMASENSDLRYLLLNFPEKVLGNEGFEGMNFSSDMYQEEIKFLRVHHCKDLNELTRYVFTAILSSGPGVVDPEE